LQKIILFSKCLQDNNDKPKSNDPTAFDKGKIGEEEFEQNDDSITIPEMKKMIPL
jgi:hypothetical protein